MQTLQQLRSGKLKGTTRLKLSCGLTSFPEEIFHLADSLEILDLSGNKLSELPTDLGRLHKLKIAFFSDNLFTEYPAVLGACKLLEMVGFKANQIQHIPENAFSENLRWLILTDNQIPEIPESIEKCSRLQKLMLAGNKLKTLPPALANCKYLQLLRISANEISELPSWLLTMPRLAWLAFAGNPCSSASNLTAALPEINWNELALTRLLGEGASGIISKATWQIPEGKKEVAVKIFKGHVTSDGLPADEMKACLAAGKYPNLVSVLGKVIGHPESKQGLVLELISSEYENLGGPPSFESCTRDTYPENTVFSIEQVLKIATGVAAAMAHLHQRGILHGDLYAHNILVDITANCLLSDFGAATIYNRQETDKNRLLERLEVRAFGYLLEDLLQHLSSENNNQTVKSLELLGQNCLQNDPIARPDFEIISNQLHSFSEAFLNK